MLFAITAMAQESITLISNNSLTGNNTQQSFYTEASLLYGMPFELSFDVTISETTADSAPTFNDWGSAILTTGTDPFATPANGLQVYLRCKGNKTGTQLVITANGSAFYFNNVLYNTDKFSVHLIQSNGQLTMEVTNNATSTGTTTGAKTVTYTKNMMFNQIDRLCYAMPTDMSVGNLSLSVRIEDITNYINNIMPLAPGYLTEEAREYFTTSLTTDGDKLDVYKTFINASLHGSDVQGRRSYILPDPGKVYCIGNYIKNGNTRNYLTLWEDKENKTANLVIKDAFDPKEWLNPDGTHKMDGSDDLYMQNLFSYLWIPRVSKTADNQMTFYHATGLGYSLSYDSGLSSSPTTWRTDNGLEQGYLALYNNSAYRYVAANANRNAFGKWGTGGMYASGKAQGPNWSTDFFFEEVSGFVPYDLNITGLTSADTYHDGGGTVDPATAKVQYQVQAGNYVDITNGGVILVGEGNENQLRNDIKTFDVNNKIAVVTIGNGIITVEYTDFETRKARALVELNAAQARLDNFAEGALYSQDAITAARTAITAANEKVSTNPKQACADLEAAMEAFYKTIDGRFVTMTNQSTNLISTTNHTNLYVRTKTSDERENYYGLYQLHYISGGAYQLRNAFEDNYIGQTTTASTVNSATNAVASRWRGTYSFDLKKTDTSTDAYNITCTNGIANTMLGISGTSIAKAEATEANKALAENLWDIRLVDVKTYAQKFIEGVTPSAMNGIIGHAPSKAVAEDLQNDINACPDRASNPTVEQETTLANAVNNYIKHKDDINKPAPGQYVTFQNRNNTRTYIGENLYEMKATNTLDLGCVWETVMEDDRYYFRNAKSGMYMGMVTQSAVGRLTEKNDGANKHEIDIIAAPGRAPEEGYVALHDKVTNNYRSYIHYSNDRNSIVGWSAASGETASHWTINAVEDETLKGYLQTATEALKTTLNTDLTTYNELGDIPGNYEKSEEVKTEASNAASASWTATTKEEALATYKAAVDAFNAFTSAGTPVANNEMFLIKTSIQLNDQQGQNPAKYFVTQVLDDSNNEALEGGSLTNGIQSTDTDDFYLFTLWQLVKDGEYYKLYNFYTGHYLSKEVSMSNNHNNRYGLTTNPDDAASFVIRPEHGCFVSFHLSDYDELNGGYLNMITTPAGSRTMFGLSSANITTTGEPGRMLFELEPSTTKHYEKCLASMLNYEIGEGVGKYTDMTGNYGTERDKVSTLINANPKPADYDALLQDAAKEFAPILAGLRINLPEAGKYYRLYSNITTSGDTKTRYYLSNASSGSYAAMVQNTGGNNVKGDTKSVFYYDGKHLLSYGNGYYIGNGSTPWIMGNIGQNYKFIFANTGYKNKGCYSIKPVGRSYLYNNNNSTLNGWSSAFNERCEWYMEEVTELPLVVSSVGYSTLVSGRDHKIPSGLTCYVAGTAEGNEAQGGELTINPINDGILPANVPVLVKGAAGTYYFTELDGETVNNSYEDNLFSGQLETINSGYTTNSFKQYTLQKPSGHEIGFYKYSGATLAGFKCYLDIDYVWQKTGAKLSALSFSFLEGEPTGITEYNDILNTSAIYDIMGRKVSTTSRGKLYIVNGKVVRF